MSGKLISLEGLDGSGKTTQAKMLVEHLRNDGYNVLHIREPGGTVLGEDIREVLLKDREIDICKESEILLFMASRMQLINHVIKPHLMEGGVVVSERFIDSTIAMQGYASGKLELVMSTLTLYLNGFKPHKTFFLNTSTELQTQVLENKVKDRIENKGVAYHDKVKQGFSYCLAHDPDRFILIHSMDKNNQFKDQNEIHKEIYTHTLELLKGLNKTESTE